MIESVIRWRLALFFVGVIALAVAYPISRQLKTEQSVVSLFGEADPTLREYREFKRWFGRNDVLVLMYRDANLASDAGIQRSETLTRQVRDIPGVAATLSPWILDRAAEGMSPGSLLPFGQSSDNPIPKLMRPDDTVGKGLSDIFSGYTHSADYTHGAVVAMVDDSGSATTVRELKRVADAWSETPGVSDVSLVGEPVLVEEAFALVRKDGARLAVLTVILLSLVVAFSLFDIRLVALLALTIAWSVIVSKALMFLLSVSLSLIASILTAIVTVIAVTAVLHLGVRYHSRRARGFSRKDASTTVLSQMAAPIFWTCATDAAGFAALSFSEILPVRQFGWMIAVSAMGVFVSLALFAPLCLTLPEVGLAQRVLPIRRSITRVLRRACLRLAQWFVGFRMATILVSLSLLVVAVTVVARGETETSFLKNFRGESSIANDYGNVEENLGGAGVWDLVLDVPAAITNDSLDQVRELEADLIRQCGKDGLSKAISIADATGVLGQSSAGKFMTAPLRIAAMRLRLPAFIDALVSEPDAGAPDRRKLRVMLRSKEDLPADQKRALIEGVDRVARRHVARWEADVETTPDDGVIVTGYYVIMTRLVDQLVSDQWRCFAGSAILIWLLMWIATGRLALATASLMPNLLPAFLVLGVVSVFGGRINVGAAMIAAVSVGLSIDGSVHLLMAYRRRLERGRSKREAAWSAAGNIGAPVMLATAALLVGFSVLSTSDFIPTATFGMLVAWALVIGTLVNLSVLPSLIGGDRPGAGKKRTPAEMP
ncbi:MAG: MMPL family transporter [Planctomycetota bacterium]